MKLLKITLIAVISSVLMVLPSTAKEFRIGVAAGMTAVNADGEETLKSSSKKTKSEASETGVIPSVFAEFAADNGWGVGLERVQGSADINSQAKSRTHVGGTGNDSGTNKASAEIDGLTSAYIIKTMQNGFFAKIGRTQTTVNTKEVLSTGSIYNDEDMTGTMFGIGYTHTNDNGVFFRASAEYTDYDDISLTSGTDVGGTANSFNKVTASVDTTAFKISVGKAF